MSLASGNDWTNIIIPGDAKSTEFHHEKTFLLVDLAQDAQYECLVQAKNQYGWSEASRIHRFLTQTNAFGRYLVEEGHESRKHLALISSKGSSITVDAALSTILSAIWLQFDTKCLGGQVVDS